MGSDDILNPMEISVTVILTTSEGTRDANSAAKGDCEDAEQNKVYRMLLAIIIHGAHHCSNHKINK